MRRDPHGVGASGAAWRSASRAPGPQRAWQQPGHERKFVKQMKATTEQGRGMAPQARHFKRQSMLTVTGRDEDDLAPPSAAPP